MFDLGAKRTLFIVMAAAFFISLAYSFYFQIRPAVDARAYDQIAWNLVQGNGYREDAALSYDADIAILRVGPGYQFFLAALYFLFGHHLQIVWIANAILLALTAGVVYLLSVKVFSENPKRHVIGVISAAFLVFSPDLITMSGMAMTEILGIFLAAFSVLLFYLYWNFRAGDTGERQKSKGFLVLSAVVFACAVMVRTPAAFLAFPLFYLWILRRRFTDMFVFIALGVLMFTPWVIRNEAIYRAFIPTNLAFGYDLLAGNHPGATGELEPYALNDEIIDRYGRVAGNHIALKEAGRFIYEHPFEFLKITAHRISIYFSIARPTGFWFHLRGWARALTLASSAVYSALLFFFGFLGVFGIKLLSGDDRFRARFLFAFLLMMPLAVVGIIVETRYRFLSYPFFAVFAGYGVIRMRERAPWNEIVIVGGVLAINTCVDILGNLGRIAGRLRDLFL